MAMSSTLGFAWTGSAVHMDGYTPFPVFVFFLFVHELGVGT